MLWLPWKDKLNLVQEQRFQVDPVKPSGTVYVYTDNKNVILNKWFLSLETNYNVPEICCMLVRMCTFELTNLSFIRGIA